MTAATVVPGQEYSKYVDGHQTIQAVGSTPFGEQISLRDGGVQFRQIDIDLPGIGPSIQIARTLQIHDGGKAYETTGNSLIGWEMDIPSTRVMNLLMAQKGCLTTKPKGYLVTPSGVR